jgi:carbonic anhydrase
MNKFFAKFALALPLISFGSAFAAEGTPSALDKLIEGNNRYVNSETVCHEDWSAKRLAKAEGQAPFAVIVTCSDSRVPPEIVFDQALGALFVVRVAGNIVDDFAIGSIEYGVSVLGADLILVLGHSGCGAVEGALKGLKFDNHIQEVLNAIQPAVQASKKEKGDALENAIRANVKYVEAKLSKSRPVLANLLKEGNLTIVGGYYDLSSGKVDFFETISK